MCKSVPGFALRQAARMDQARTERRSRIAEAKLLYRYGRQEKIVGALATL
jgi:hypothetical protein